MDSKICAVCGAEFFKSDRASRGEWGKRKYCSRLCANLATAKRKKSVEERFWNFVEKIPSGCWEWKGALDGKGYGTISTKRGSSPKKAHRVSWEIHFGSIKEGLEVCHACDNPSCVNPNHLLLGTHKANMTDAHRKKRIDNYKHEKGERGNSATLTSEQVLKIRSDYKNGKTISELSKEYRHTNIGRIVRNICYQENISLQPGV